MGVHISIKLSVIVPIFEQWHLIPRLLECLAEQSYPADLVEILLIDNGSNKFIPPDPMKLNVRILYADMPGSYAARNQGIKHARGKWLVFTDADCLPNRDWLSEIARAGGVGENKNIYIAGCIESIFHSKEPTIYEIYDVVRGIPQAHFVNKGYAATANLAVPRDLADRLGGFKSELYSGGDVDFCRRAKSIGFSIVYVSSAIVQHRARTSWNAVATKARRIKGGQLAFKPIWYKVLIVFRTLLSPFISMYHYGSANQHPVKHRLVAIMVYMRIWAVEIVELCQVMLGKDLERR